MPGFATAESCSPLSTIPRQSWPTPTASTRPSRSSPRWPWPRPSRPTSPIRKPAPRPNWPIGPRSPTSSNPRSASRRDAEARQARLGVFVGRIDAERRAIVGDGLRARAALFVDHGAIVVGQDKARRERHGLGVVRNRLVELALAPIGEPAIVIGEGFAAVVVGGLGVGLQRDRPGVVGDGLVVEALGVVAEPSIHVGVGVVGVQRQGLVLVGDGLVVEALVVFGEAAIVVLRRQFRARIVSRFDQGGAALDGLIVGRGGAGAPVGL